jgi:two-component system sensor histidine kinase DegS
MSEGTPTAPPSLADLSSRLHDDLLALDSELTEVDLLITQARTEAGRHETRRVAGADKVASLGQDGDPIERADAAAALVTLTKRASLMETQVEVLEGKRRALARYRDAVASYLETLGDAGDGISGALGGGLPSLEDLPADAPMPPAVSRMILGGQEDLRREIARQMHDGPAQSLSNIVLQAQIVERLVDRDPSMASGEVRLLIAMVQQTLESTKSFIFDVRPMVLDDLGLVPTLRRAARDRGGRAGVPVEFDSLGQDRRLPMDLESGLFRMLDEALTGYLGLSPDRVTLRLDWGEQQLDARLSATRAMVAPPPSPVPTETPPPPGDKKKRGEPAELPPALAMMIREREADARDAIEAARLESIVVLPSTAWREIQSRAASIGVTAELLAEGGELHLVADIPAIERPDAAPTPD